MTIQSLRHSSLYFSFVLFLFIGIQMTGGPVYSQDEEDSVATTTSVRDLTGEEFVTKDGVKLSVSYYPSLGSKDVKETPVILIIHDWKSSRRQVSPLAASLQKAGYAVVVPDLRGHGDSTRAINPRTRKDIKIDANRLTGPMVEAMVKMDIEQIKRFIVTKNDEGVLNVQKLGIIGIGPMGSYLATAYASFDWSWGKVGDVKALGMVSPEMNFRGMMIKTVLSNQVLNEVSALILCGTEDSDVVKDCKSINQLFDKARPGDKKAPIEEKTIFLTGIGTRIQGTQLIGQDGGPLEARVIRFMDLRLKDQEIFWKQRRDN